ncbi:MAG: VOC family protein [Acidobacteriota bacterium]
MTHEWNTTDIIYLVFAPVELVIDQCFERLSQDGAVLMPLAAYPFSQQFGWIQDRFGVSWQFSLD